MVLSIAFTFYQTLDLEMLEKSVYSLTRQTALDRVSELVFVDNNTAYEPDEIRAVVEPYFQEPFVKYHFLKHGLVERAQCWSTNYVIQHCENERFFYTHGDFIHTEDAIERMDDLLVGNMFTSGWAYLLHYLLKEKPLVIEPDYETFDWRSNVRNLLACPNSAPYPEADLDAATYMCTKSAMEAAGWYDEAMASWGFQQSVIQRHLTKAGTRIAIVPDYLNFHMYHYVDRDFTVAYKEYYASRGG